MTKTTLTENGVGKERKTEGEKGKKKKKEEAEAKNRIIGIIFPVGRVIWRRKLELC